MAVKLGAFGVVAGRNEARTWLAHQRPWRIKLHSAPGIDEGAVVQGQIWRACCRVDACPGSMKSPVNNLRRAIRVMAREMFLSWWFGRSEVGAGRAVGAFNRPAPPERKRRLAGRGDVWDSGVPFVVDAMLVLPVPVTFRGQRASAGWVGKLLTMHQNNGTAAYAL